VRKSKQRRARKVKIAPFNGECSHEKKREETSWGSGGRKSKRVASYFDRRNLVYAPETGTRWLKRNKKVRKNVAGSREDAGILKHFGGGHPKKKKNTLIKDYPI